MAVLDFIIPDDFSLHKGNIEYVYNNSVIHEVIIHLAENCDIYYGISATDYKEKMILSANKIVKDKKEFTPKDLLSVIKASKKEYVELLKDTFILLTVYTPKEAELKEAVNSNTNALKPEDWLIKACTFIKNNYLVYTFISLESELNRFNTAEEGEKK